MKLLPRRNSEPAVNVVNVAGETSSTADAAGKGRPTPKRRDSALQRGPVSAPKTRKEAYARQKQQTKAAREARRSPAAAPGTPAAKALTPQQRRAALRSGDASVLPRRDQGRTKQLARDYVDTHRMFSNFLLLLFPLMIASYLIPGIQFLVIAVFFGLLVEWNLVGRRVRKLAVERFGEADASAMSLGFYAGSRAYLPRRWRLPAPRKERGEQI